MVIDNLFNIFEYNAVHSVLEEKMPYMPKPIDTSNVTLPQELYPLIETLAEHNHDIWAQERMKSGWMYGEQRDDLKKTHPDLVPYRDLSESEKEYDRKSAVGVLKAIIALGYSIRTK